MSGELGSRRSHTHPQVVNSALQGLHLQEPLSHEQIEVEPQLRALAWSVAA